MYLSQHDIRQLSQEYVQKCIDEGRILEFTMRLVYDMQELCDQLNQNPSNSSRPPSSQAPWENTPKKSPRQSDLGLPASPDKAIDQQENSELENCHGQSQKDGQSRSPANTPTGKKAGKQQGAKGYGRTQNIAPDRIEHHHPPSCAACGASLNHDGENSQTKAYTGRDEIDITHRPDSKIGLHLHCTHHLLYETTCTCGHRTRAQPYVAPSGGLLWDKIELGEWRLIGPSLAGAIVFLSLRMRLSRSRIREFCAELLNLHLSTGVIDETIREAGRAMAPLEDELIESIEQAVLLNIDETPWKESGKVLWLWVFASVYTVVYYIGPRTLEMLNNVLTDAFKGNAMTDGYLAYRHLPNRLRCWAHLLRKLQGLADSTDNRVARTGQTMMDIFYQLMEAVYQARASNCPMDISKICEKDIARLHQLCSDHQHDKHDKLRALAREFLLDWDIILRQIKEPHLPLTNNAAEQALRHWVIARRISQGTRSESGTRAFAMLASVVDTCRRRKASAWRYLACAIACARKGLQLPRLPQIPVGG